LRHHYVTHRNYFVRNLAKSFNLNFYFPRGGYFIVADISQQNVPEAKDRLEGDEGVEYHKDFNYMINLANEKKVVCIPASVFYTQENKSSGENFVRLAFCKQKTTLDKAINNLVNN